MLRLNGLAAGQVRDGPRDPQDAVVAPGRQTQGVEGLTHQAGAGLVEGTVLPELGLLHPGVAGNLVRPVTGLLELSRPVHPLSNLRRALRRPGLPQVLKGHDGHLDDEVDPVQQRTADPAEIAVHRRLRAGTAAGGIAVPAALAGIHGADQHEVAGIADGAAHTGDRHAAVLEGLPQDLEGLAAEFRQLVQEEDAPLTGSSCLSQIVFEPTHFRYFGCPPYIYSRIPGDTKRGGVHPTTTKPPDCICYSGGS